MQTGDLRGQLDEVLSLQSVWTARPTPAMLRRGRVVLHGIPAWIRERLPLLVSVMPGATDDLAVDASDGAGAKARVPWTRVFSSSRSPGASEGWYVVYLFDALGSAAYASLNQGTTQWLGGNFERRPAAVTFARANWARGVLGEVLATRADLWTSIDLLAGAAALPAGYERGNVAAFRYPADAVPDDAVLAADLRFLVQCLGTVYLAEERALQLPGDPVPEVSDAIQAAELIARPLRKRPKLPMSPAERRAVERRAVDVAIEHLKGEGFIVADVGATRSYDLDARNGSLRLYVEVKGTTSAGEEVVLTQNEVDVHRREHPATMLILVTGIHLDRTGVPPTATGGVLRRIYPWAIDDADIIPIQYRYRVPDSE